MPMEITKLTKQFLSILPKDLNIHIYYFWHNQMKYIIVSLAIFLTRASLEMTGFYAHPTITAIHQLNSTVVIAGSEGGELRVYLIKNGQLVREQYFHKDKVVFIQSYAVDNATYILTADASGLIAVWNSNMAIQQSVDVKMKIKSIVTSIEANSQNIAINTGSQIHLYNINLSFVRSIPTKNEIIKLQYADNNLAILFDNQGLPSIALLSLASSELRQMPMRQQGIYDFSLQQIDSTWLLYLIDSSRHLKMYYLDANMAVINSTREEKNLVFSQNYTSVSYFKQQKELPMFVTVKQGGKIEFRLRFQILMFIQFNHEVKLLESNIHNSLLFLSSNHRIIVATMSNTQQGNDIWIILLILLLLAVGLYLCLSDCCPGVYEKWKQERQRKEIEMVLYKQKSQLDNF